MTTGLRIFLNFKLGIFTLEVLYCGFWATSSQQFEILISLSSETWKDKTKC